MSKRKLNSYLLVLSMFVISISPLIITQIPMAKLVANFPGFPSWLVSALSVATEAATAISLVVALLTTAGVAATAFPIAQYITKYGIKRGLIL